MLWNSVLFSQAIFSALRKYLLIVFGYNIWYLSFVALSTNTLIVSFFSFLMIIGIYASDNFVKFFFFAYNSIKSL